MTRWAITFILLGFLSPKELNPLFAAGQKRSEKEILQQALAEKVEAKAEDVVLKKVAPQPVKQVIDKGLHGLQIETPNPEWYQKLKKQAQDFADFKSQKAKPEVMAAFVAQCLSEAESNPFCEYIYDDWKEDLVLSLIDEEDDSSSDKHSALLRLQMRKELPDAIRKGDVRVFKHVKENDVHRALRQVENWEGLEALYNAASSRSYCAPPQLLLALGMKMETFFPDLEFRKRALKLYQRADDCGARDETEMVSLARFRYGLIQVWNNRCDLAEPILEKLAKDVDGNFPSRALYWLASCAKQKGDKLNFAIMRNRLIKVNPLSYHGLSLNQGKLVEVVNLLYQNEPQLYLRSEKMPHLNRMVRAVEMLQVLHEDALARNILGRLDEQLGKSEPQFRLYVAILNHRASRTIPHLRHLSETFGEDPTLISETTLKLFFPIKLFDTLQRYRNWADPYLVASLIRQESAFNPYARSSVGALGLMQLMPATARSMQRKISRQALLRPSDNIRLGTKYFGQMLKRYDNNPELALAAYNAGPHRVDRWLKQYPVKDRMLFMDLIPFTETRNYVALIGRNYYWYLSLYAPSVLYVENTGRGLAAAHQRANFAAFDFE